MNRKVLFTLAVPALVFGCEASPKPASEALDKADAVAETIRCEVPEPTPGGNSRPGFIDALQLEVIGAEMRRVGTSMDFNLEVREEGSTESTFFYFPAATQKRPPDIKTTKLSASWGFTDAQERPFYDASIELKGRNGVTYKDALGLSLDVALHVPFRCTRGEPEEPTASETLTIHVASNLEEIAEIGAEQLGTTVDELDFQSGTLKCLADEGLPNLPGTETPTGVCLIYSLTAQYSINAGMTDDQSEIVYHVHRLSKEQ